MNIAQPRNRLKGSTRQPRPDKWTRKQLYFPEDPSVGAFAVGMAQAALDASGSNVTRRRAFGGVLGDQQAVQHLLADMATRLSPAAARLRRRFRLRRRRAARRRHPKGGHGRAVRDRARTVVDRGAAARGAGAAARHPLEHLYREVRAPRIYEGASEVQRTIIGRSLVAAAGDEQAELMTNRFRASVRLTDDWQHFDFAVADGVATVTLNRPEKLNPLTFEAYADLRDLLAELPHRGDVRVLVIRGDGKGFCARRRRQRDHRRADQDGRRGS